MRVFRGDVGDGAFIRLLGGGHADRLLDGGVPESQAYWLRVWAMRGVLWAWDGRPVTVLADATTDPAWRVREMAAKVVARHAVGDLLGSVEELRGDPVPRVRTAAERAVAAVVAAEA